MLLVKLLTQLNGPGIRYFRFESRS